MVLTKCNAVMLSRDCFMQESYDVVVVGSGHNGLIVACYLAKAGQKVLVLERNSWYGGGVYTAESVAPGFRHDWHSAIHILIQANPLLANDELGLKSKYGLRYANPERVFSTIFDDQSSIVTYGDLDRTCESIAKLSRRDADAYRQFAEKSAKLLPLIVQGLFVPPAPQGAFWALLDQSREGQELMQIMQRSTLDLVREMFENEKVMIHLLKFAAEVLISPGEKGTGGILFNMPGFVHAYSPGVAIGGSGALVDALIACLRDHGGELRNNVDVEKAVVSGGRAVGVRLKGGDVIAAKTAVVGQIHPWFLGEFIDGLDPTVTANAKRTKTAGHGIFISHYAMDKPPEYYAGEEAGRATLIGMAPKDLDGYIRSFDDIRHGEMPRRALLTANVMSQFDPTRAPPGKAALSITGHAPFELRDGGAQEWDARKEAISNSVGRQFSEYCSNFTPDNVKAFHFDSPLDVRRHSPTFQGGAGSGLGSYFHQIGGHRPTPDLAQYAVPGIDRMYLAGTFMHPPGGVTGGGRATAIKIIGDLGMDFDKIVGA
ncbi:NAD(P)/FAD-dependent oxidoreductase [Bradyrhizobium sp. CB82]|uniref:phytoene desaturase family protein n=1 Tax=Bradyrhizobium sp. CB82 TaxID=3039159 RepID=UPI0024B1209A|nr:NAD(P)/FAD-dependent oxidoreductase [Bradyrhizobium sp. CB82]WFU41526.1 NAD(P)/FAD-dependent oxidoreductase [Bradyrhizobium sp. CB82]